MPPCAIDSKTFQVSGFLAFYLHAQFVNKLERTELPSRCGPLDALICIVCVGVIPIFIGRLHSPVIVVGRIPYNCFQYQYHNKGCIPKPLWLPHVSLFRIITWMILLFSYLPSL